MYGFVSQRRKTEKGKGTQMAGVKKKERERESTEKYKKTKVTYQYFSKCIYQGHWK